MAPRDDGRRLQGISKPRVRAVGSLVQRTDHIVIESLDAVLLLLADLGLGFDNVPELDNVILILNVD